MEILSPAGSFEMAVAAVSNGACAIYLGMRNDKDSAAQEGFSARQNAQNFDKHELLQVVRYCHARGVLVYLALNTVVFDSQLDKLAGLMRYGCSIGIDAFIVQDLAVVYLAKKICPTMPLHGSTQMTIHSVHGALSAKSLGLSRAILARELSFEEIKRITQSVDIETEVFVHGALCMSVSGQCYMSSFIGTRSGNRGNCAGTCRLPFSVNNETAFNLSLKDLALEKRILKLSDIGVASIKIEGRMKRPEYAATSASVYSNILESKPYDLSSLQSIFSRNGFTTGYFDNKIDRDMYGTRQKEDVVLATNKLLSTIQNSYKGEQDLIKVNMDIVITKGSPISLTITDINGNFVTATDDENLPQLAVNLPTSKEQIRKNLLKLGDTFFFCDDVTVTMDDDLYIPAATINQLRRTACERLHKLREQIKAIPTNEYDFASIISTNRIIKKPSMCFYTRIGNVNQLTTLVMSTSAMVIVPISVLTGNLERFIPIKDKVIVEPDRVMFNSEDNVVSSLKSLFSHGFTRLLTSNIAHISIGNSLGFSIIGDSFLNCTNSLSLLQYSKLGVSQMCLSAEIPLNKSRHLRSQIPIGAVVYGYYPLMICRNCPIKNQINCKDCNRQNRLIDRTKAEFKVSCQLITKKAYSEIYNSTPIYLADKLDDFSHFDFLLLYFTDETANSTDSILSSYIDKTPSTSGFTRGLYYRGLNKY